MCKLTTDVYYLPRSPYDRRATTLGDDIYPCIDAQRLFYKTCAHVLYLKPKRLRSWQSRHSRISTPKPFLFIKRGSYYIRALDMTE